MNPVVFRAEAVQLVSALPSADLWYDVTPWIPTTNVSNVRGVLTLVDNPQVVFQVRIGIQTAPTDIELPSAPLAPSVGTGLGYTRTTGKLYFDFDPADGSNGNVASAAFFRVGLLYSSSDATTIARAELALRVAYGM